MNQSEFPSIICILLKAREKSRIQGAIGFASDWLKVWREAFKVAPYSINSTYTLRRMNN